MIRQLQNAGPTVKIILGALLVLICASMAITLIPGGIGSSFGIGAPPAGVLASIGDQQVTVAEVQREARAMIRQQFPRGGAQASMLLPYFASQAAQQLINEKALVAEAHRMGLRVNDDELRDELQHGQLGAILFPDGKFAGQEEYENFVQRNDMTVPQFESLEKDFILVRKLRALVSTSAFVGDAEVHDEFNHRNTKVKFEYAVLTQADILKGLHPTDGELKAYYERSKANYNNSIPEKRQIKYVVVESAKIAAAGGFFGVKMRHTARFSQHIFRICAPFRSTHFRNNAVCAPRVTAILYLHNRPGFPSGSSHRWKKIIAIIFERRMHYFGAASAGVFKSGNMLSQPLFFRISHNKRHSGNACQCVWIALRIASSNHDLCIRVVSVHAANCLTDLLIGSMRDRAGVHDNQIGIAVIFAFRHR